MTFTVVARNRADGSLGLSSATGAIAVGSRCSHVAGGVAAVTTQYHTDWRLGPAAIALLEAGIAPQAALDELRSLDEYFEFRQIGIVDHAGAVAVSAGRGGHVLTGDGYALLGNGIVGTHVLDAMQDAWEAASEDEIFEERLLATIEAGMLVGGDAGGHLSASLLTASADQKHPRVSLRVDRSHTPPAAGGNAVHELRSIFDDYRPFIDYYDSFWPAHPSVTPTEYLSLHTR